MLEGSAGGGQRPGDQGGGQRPGDQGGGQRPGDQGGGQRPGDEGGADPTVAAALSAYASGTGSEHAALTALASSRLLVPVVAVLTDAADGADAANGVHETPGQPRRCDIDSARARSMSHRRHRTRSAGASAGAGAGEGAGEEISEMALPTLVGNDGRVAVLAFTCLDSLRRWRPDARPIPVPAQRVWQAATQEASAVVIDVAGPVPLAVDGARLAALADGRRVPLPHEDPDIAAVTAAALASETLIASGMLADPGDGSDVGLRVTLAAGCDPAQAGAAVRRAVTCLMAATGGRFRRGVEVAVVEAGRAPGRS